MSGLDHASLSLFLATEAQTLESFRRTHPSWSRGMKEEEYIRHNQHILDTFECAKDGKLVVWVLAPRNNPETLDFKSSCETFRRRGLVSDKDCDEVKKVTCYGIASVFTPPQHRGLGYARHMMSLLHWVLASEDSLQSLKFPQQWGQPPSRVSGFGDARFSVLWSDVGKFYAACGPAEGEVGWTIRDPNNTIWDVQNLSDRLQSTSVKSTELKWMGLHDLKECWEKDVTLIEKEMKSVPRRPAFTFLPTDGVESFQRMRLEFVWKKQGVQEWGVWLPGSELAFATWTVELRETMPRKLLLTRLRAHQSNFETILAAIVQVAKKHNITCIEVWNLDEHLHNVARDLAGVTSERNDHLPAFKWYGSHGNEKPEGIQWVHNEKFCWC